MKIGLGIVTYNRPDYFKQCIEAVEKHLLDVADVIWVYNDGSKKDYSPIVAGMDKKINYAHPEKNKGVGQAKNALLKKLMDAGCDYMFLLEDDIIVKSPKAVTGYIELSNKSGIEHFMFAHHGPANWGKCVKRINGIDLYPNCVGAWCLYTRNVINKVGYFDNKFKNAWEHVEHTFRICKAGYTSPWGLFPDATDSHKWLEEIPGSIDHSSIRPRLDWMSNIINGLIYWRTKSKDFPLQHILDGLLKEEAEEYKRLGVKNVRLQEIIK